MTSIGDCAFENCSGLTSVVLPNSVSNVGYESFGDCANLRLVRLPLTFACNRYAFTGCSSIEVVEVPGRYNLYDLFPDAHDIKTVIIKDGETDMSADVGHYFVSESDYYCHAYVCRTNLTAIAIPNSVTNIGSSLTGCIGLRKITLPRNLKGWVSFAGCSSLEEIDIPEGVEGLPNSAFDGCACLKSLSLPKSLISIGDSVFYGCRSIGSITVAEDNPNFSVKDGCLVNKAGTRLFVMPISYGAVTIPDGIATCEWYSFGCCEGMTSLSIPDSLTTISPSQFNSCTNLAAFVVSDTHPTYSTIDGVLMSKDGSSIMAIPARARRVTIPDGMTVNASTFNAYSELASIVVSDANPNYKFQSGLLLSKAGSSIVAIPKGATSITIPGFVTNIDSTLLPDADTWRS